MTGRILSLFGAIASELSQSSRFTTDLNMLRLPYRDAGTFVSFSLDGVLVYLDHLSLYMAKISLFALSLHDMIIS